MNFSDSHKKEKIKATAAICGDGCVTFLYLLGINRAR